MYYELGTAKRLRSDIKFYKSTDGGTTYFDESIQDYTADNDLQNAYLISILTNKAIDTTEFPDKADTNGNGGFWGDSVLGFSIGSKLWTLDRSRITNSALDTLKEYTLDALQWMISDKIVDHNDATVERIGTSKFIVRVSSTLADKVTVIKFAYYYDWYTMDVGGANGLD